MTLANSIDAKITGFQSLNAATGAWTGRTITAGTGISVTNGDGTGGNPTIAVSPATTPGFSAYLSANDTNVTGNAAYYLIGTNTGMVEEFDNGNVFTPGPVAGGAVFTTPTTGVYTFQSSVGITGITAAMTRGQILLDVNGTTTAYLLSGGNTSNMRNDLNSMVLSGAITVSLTVGDLVRFAVQIFNGAGNTAGLAGLSGAVRQCTVSGFQVR